MAVCFLLSFFPLATEFSEENVASVLASSPPGHLGQVGIMTDGKKIFHSSAQSRRRIVARALHLKHQSLQDAVEE
jgi:uncharacterized protein YaiE (UPF0345 family)